ncbi:WD repeat-containing protein 82 [Seminavis robusta]|uniref:WD repeat-containing protein 82 n=1 Tax=Seminavis robusta TaxID=568900 RepID=A0A9N8H4I4_9STRA|nr:WD repeat-containing protein 82 [Seminavis robusta]|eukprot:Sro85_g045230.1 WD repeat-containing protein 82 (345) ;mRNA; f:32591-33888
MDFTSTPDRPAVAAVVSGSAPIVSMSYQEDGSRLFVASESDNTLRVIDCLTGKPSEAVAVPLRCDRERLHFVTTTHHPNCVLFAGKGSPTQPLGQRNAINYWSIHDNKILRKFRGHTDTVSSISVSPADDKFLTSSKDRTIRLWNVEEAGSMAQLQLPASATGTPRAVFDSTGLVFAVSAGIAGGKGQYVHLYDARQYGAGGFAELTVSPEGMQQAITSHIGAAGVEYSPTAAWTSLQFNASGNQLLAGTSEGLAIVLDGFEATVQRVVAPTFKSSAGAVCCFTSDDKTVLMGNPDGSISCFHVDTGAIVKTLTGHSGPISAVATNPKYAQFASACSSTALWSW